MLMKSRVRCKLTSSSINTIEMCGPHCVTNGTLLGILLKTVRQSIPSSPVPGCQHHLSYLPLLHDSMATPADAKSKIKKLTADKIRDSMAQIARKNGGEIDLAGRGIETILSLDGLQRATKLDLSRNKLTKLSDLKRVQGLTMLKLTDNRLNGEVRGGRTNQPVADLHALERVIVRMLTGCTRPRSLSQGLSELQHLKKIVILNVAENQVARIPVEVLRNLRTLKALVLNNNSITTLEWLPKLPVRAFAMWWRRVSVQCAADGALMSFVLLFPLPGAQLAHREPQPHHRDPSAHDRPAASAHQDLHVSSCYWLVVGGVRCNCVCMCVCGVCSLGLARLCLGCAARTTFWRRSLT